MTQTSPTSQASYEPQSARVQRGIVLGSTLGLATSCLTLTSYATGLFVIPLSEAFHWSRQEILTAPTFLTATTFITSLIVGALTDRLPLRRLIIASQIGFGLAYLALAAFTGPSLSLFYALHILMAVLAGGTLPMTFTRLISTQFTKRRGLAIGIALSGTGFCGLIMPGIVTSIIQSYGWRAGYVALGLMPIAVALFASSWLFPKAADRPAAQTRDPSFPQSPDVSLRAALADRRFWTMGIAFFLGSGVSNGIVANLVPLLRDGGMNPLTAASAISVFGISVIAGRIMVGFLVDRFWAPPIALALMIPAAIAALLLAQGSVGVLEAYLLAVLLGLATGAEGDLLSYLTGRYFGLKHIGQLYAVLFVFFSAGIGVATPLFGRSFDLYKSYNVALYGSAIAWLVCGGLLMTLGRYPKKV